MDGLKEWISVKDRLPENSMPVLCNFRHWNIQKDRQNVLIYVDEDDCDWRVWDLGDYKAELSHSYDVTHWMPLPDPPKEVSNGD